MKKLSYSERRRRRRVKKYGGGFYFNFNYDKYPRRYKKRNNTWEKIREGSEIQLVKFPPQKMKVQLNNVITGKKEIKETNQCCAAIIGTDPPIRCRKSALKGQDFCRSHGGIMIKTNHERELHKYSDEELREQIENIVRGDLLDIKEEIAIVVLVLRKHIESMLRKKDKLNNLDIKLFLDIVDSVTKNVERLNKMKYGEDIVTKDKLEKILVDRTKKEIMIIEKLVENEKLRIGLLNEFANIGSVTE